ncbi:MAG TPA: aldehyde dehydrogenase family protein [Steroidobacteraceae bacterium]|nr:aldehyde dehydrogenase family protein [Steroidobacteraceae bacterium]
MRQIWVGGAWVDARTDAIREISNPATLKVLDAVPECAAEDVSRAVAAARAARPEWQRTAPARRGALLRDVAMRIGSQSRELAALLTREGGKPLCEARDCLDAAARIFDRYGVLCETQAGEAGHAAAPDAPGSSGVAAVIAPFNFPLLILAACVARELAAGHTVVCKPPPQNPLSSLELLDRCAALPAGVINVLTGGSAAAEALAAHPHVARVSFTGSCEAARRIESVARGKALEAQSGSLDTFIVCADADLDVAVPGIAWARLMNAGQTCAAPRHIYIERSIAADFAERLHQCIGFLDVDDPSKPATDLGPLISLEAARRVEDQVGRALRAGAKLILGGRRFRPSGLPGHFFQPTILTDVPAGSAPTCEEILGPVITLTPVAGLAHALELMSGGAAALGAAALGAAIYTGRADEASSLVGSRSGGAFRINDPARADAGPFGSLRPGLIRTALGIAPCTAQAASIGLESASAAARRPWWFPYLERNRGAA